MAIIFISYSSADKDYAAQLAAKLRQHHQIVYFDELSLGDNWRKQLTERQAQAEIFIIILSQVSVSSAYPMAELGRALGRAEQGDVRIIPIAIDDVSIPPLLQDRLVLRAAGRSLDEYYPEIISAISAFEGSREERTQRLKAVEQDLSEFVDDAISQQRAYEKKNEKRAEIWQLAGIVFLLSVVLVASLSVYKATYNTVALGQAAPSLLNVVPLIVVNIIIIGVMSALARYYTSSPNLI